jgi:hypothetical protein
MAFDKGEFVMTVGGVISSGTVPEKPFTIGRQSYCY